MLLAVVERLTCESWSLVGTVVEPLIVGVPRDAVRVVLVCVAAVAVAVLAIVPRCDAWLRAAAKPARVKN